MSNYSETPSLKDIKQCIEKRLFINNIPIDQISEKDVKDIFSKFGSTSEVKVLADKQLCYVGFHTWAAAHRALQQLDGKPLPGYGKKPVIITFASRSQKDWKGANWDKKKYQKGDTNTRVFIEGLKANSTESGVKAYCKSVGSASSVKLFPKGKTTSALVGFRIWGEAADAVEQLGDPDRGISVILARPPPEAGHKDDSWWYADEWEDDAGWWQWEEFEDMKNHYVQALDDEATPDDQLADMHKKLLRKRRQVFGIPDKGSLPIGAASCKKLLLSGLPEGFTQKELERMLSMLTESDDLGPIELPTYKMTSSNSATLEFKSNVVADKARKSLDDSTLEYRGDQPITLRATWVSDTSGSTSRTATAALGRRIFIARCKKGLRHQDVKPHVEEFGEILELRPLAHRGVVYVTFAKEEDAQKAVDALNDAAVPAMSIRPEVKLVVEIARAE